MIHKHFKTREKFDQEFFKLPSSISDNDICFIKDTGEIWTHGRFYAQTDDILESIEDLEDQSEVIAAAIVDLDKSFGDLGKVFLKKNIVNGTNVLTQEMLSSTDTIYSIAYDYVCNSTITIPSNCVLEFNGGSISGGTITLQNTKLEGEVKWDGTTISGSCTNDTLTPQMFGAYPALVETESNKIQHTLAFENLARVINNPNVLSKTIFISGGHYAINKKITIESDCRLYGDGNLSVIDLYEGKGGLCFGKTSGLFETLECTITQDVPKFDTKMVVDDSSELNIGDYITLLDTVDGSFNSSRNYYRTCECLKIKAIENDNVYFENITYGDYYVNFGENDRTTMDSVTNRTAISKFYPNTYTISDINLYSHEHQNDRVSTYYTLQIKGFCNGEFDNITIENYGNSVAANISLGLNFKVNHSIFRNYATSTGDAYGLVITNSQNFYVSNSTFRANSHALATGGSGGYINMNNRNFIYDNLYLETSEKFGNNLDDEYTYIDLDVHANAEYYKFINISAPQTSCDTGGYNVTVEGCKFYKVTPSFNQGDFCIRKCELFGENGNFLMTNNNRKNYNGHNSLVIEDCIIHKTLNINLQDNALVKDYFDYFIIKNNIFHKNINLRNGRIDFLSIDNNVFTGGSIILPTNAPITVNNLSFKNNLLQNGIAFLGFGGDKLSEGVITGNTLILKEQSPSSTIQHVLSLYHFKGNVINNVIISYINDKYELILAGQESDINISDNYLQKDYGSTPKALVIATTQSNVVLERNRHNSIRASIVNVSEYKGRKSKAFADYFSSFTSENSMLDGFSADNIVGKLSYIKKENKVLYAGAKKKGTIVISLYVFYQGNEDTDIKQHTLTYGRSYVVNISGSGSDKYYLYFSKYNTDDPNFNENDLKCVLYGGGVGVDYVFTAERVEDYPYIYAKTDATSGSHTFRIYENNIICEIDGAAFGVNRRGTTEQRPEAENIYLGFKYWDTDLNKEITLTEIKSNYGYWREYDGAIAGVRRSGITSQRPLGLYNATSSQSNAVQNIYVGFRYFDTDLNKEIYASAIDGDNVTWDFVEDITKEPGLSSNSDDRVPSSKAVANYIRDTVSDKIVFVQEALFKRRPCSDHSSDVYGSAKIKSIKGNTILWNQIISPRTVPKSYEANETLTKAACYPFNISFNTVQGHKYYVSCLIYSSFENNSPFTFRRNVSNSLTTIYLVPNKYTRFSFLFSVAIDANTSDKIQLYNQNTFTTSEAGTIVAKGPTVIDLTKIFGEGYEPTTAEEFENWLDKNIGLCDSYKDETKLLSSNIVGFKITGFNQFNLSTGKANLIRGLEYEITGNYTSITIDGLDIVLTNGKFTPDRNCELIITGGDSTTCVHLVWDGNRDGEYETYSEQIKSVQVNSLTGKLNGQGTSVTVFSDGLKKYSDDIYDEIIVGNGVTKAIKRVGSRAYNSETDENLLNDGITTYYALDTPETYIIDDFSLPIRYSCDEYSIEEIIYPDPQTDELTSCSPTLSMVYGDTLGDAVDLLSDQIGSRVEELYVYK